MGFLKQFKDMKESVEAAPGMVKAAREMGAQAQQMAVAQQAASQAQMAQFQQNAAAAPSGAVAEADMEPIAGVSLELYAEISKGLAAYDYDQSKGPLVAATKGVSAGSWDTAVAGWNERIQRNRAIGQEFNRLYMGR